MSGKVFSPQPGPQEVFLSSSADIAIYGGAAFSGKSVAILLDAARGIDDAGWSATIFRRTNPQIVAPGGLWKTSEIFYSELGGHARENAKQWVWPSGAAIGFSHLQHEKDKTNWQGSAIPFLGFDELTHFSMSTFFYLQSRNRLSKECAYRPYTRATCNPEADSWVATFIAWWIDQDTGLAYPERSGVIRYFVREGDAITWADTPEELHHLCPHDPLSGELIPPKSVTFISAKIHDNKLGMQNDPGYIGNLYALAMVERERLLNGNWKIRASAGMLFQRSWFNLVDAIPLNGRTIRYWDRAATEPSSGNPDPDWTVGTLVNYNGGKFTVLDVVRVRLRPDGVMKTITMTAEVDGEDTEVWLEEDPGQAGKSERASYLKENPELVIRWLRPKGSKVQRAMPMSAQAEAGNINVLRAPWNAAWFTELEAFADWNNLPDDMVPTTLPHDDQVDTLSGAGHVLIRSPTE